MLRIQAIDHVVIRAIDLERMVAFYRDVLGCPVERRRDDLGLVHLRAGDSLIDLVAVDGRLGRAGGAAPGREARNMEHLCLRIEDFDHARLREAFARVGVDVGPEEDNFGAHGDGPSLYLRDPEGNGIELKAAVRG
ncbi:VOC family protein [Dokdonella sp. MW10]|uniref:VOC family protein n=1 Tax=Dokdonella sp. MW10 TaxID=2992926 RepID=UPI003F823963